MKILGAKLKQNEKKNKMVAPVIEHITQTLESLRKHYWLAGGSLLPYLNFIPFILALKVSIYVKEPFLDGIENVVLSLTHKMLILPYGLTNTMTG